MLKLNVPDMTCGHCAGVVEKAVRAVAPAATVTVDLSSKLVTIDTAVSIAAVSGAIQQAGYANKAA